ncbi:XisI protein [Tolypothrix tenuis PCC 7101]|uniref:XisI protein n=1 Tax=Tolypothrix tenuis PCC 7101 TaxID=231146 RepID=A0A1Z4MZZ1_9CYAN|nr:MULTISPECIES: XisI protein [unclassified Tolypothrix]MBD2238840.1 XisI protein [Aulosira sp. FACHB-113]BAY94981.1 XisI protein [Microchaete diplosiphon NIES-3275]BAY99023.1 XisI protein [Tolypothrix tenuis PCC 7101]BAZ77056.1 XisI protein [Aulosira laxa NIES-50]EKF00735.1 heterocyst differentiation protein [Tolypothrix sp. PCC 7601]
MEKLENYRQYIQNILTQHGKYKYNHEEIENQLIFDTIHDHYQLMRIGWNGLSRVYHSIIHFDIKNGKIWIQQNMTDIDLAQELLEMGVPKEDIVFGLQPPYKRPYTGYGVA